MNRHDVTADVSGGMKHDCRFIGRLHCAACQADGAVAPHTPTEPTTAPRCIVGSKSSDPCPNLATMRKSGDLRIFRESTYCDEHGGSLVAPFVRLDEPTTAPLASSPLTVEESKRIYETAFLTRSEQGLDFTHISDCQAAGWAALCEEAAARARRAAFEECARMLDDGSTGLVPGGAYARELSAAIRTRGEVGRCGRERVAHERRAVPCPRCSSPALDRDADG